MLHANKLTKFRQNAYVLSDFDADFHENNYNEVLSMISARENNQKLTMEFAYFGRQAKIDDLHRKLKVFNEHPSLSVYKYTKYVQVYA